MLIHDIDAARMLMGAEITSVFAQTANLAVDAEGIDGFADNATVALTFDNGALGHFHGSVDARYGYDIRAEIFGADGAIEIGRLNHHDVTLRTEADGLTQPSTTTLSPPSASRSPANDRQPSGAQSTSVSWNDGDNAGPPPAPRPTCIGDRGDRCPRWSTWRPFPASRSSVDPRCQHALAADQDQESKYKTR